VRSWAAFRLRARRGRGLQPTTARRRRPVSSRSVCDPLHWHGLALRDGKIVSQHGMGTSSRCPRLRVIDQAG
jgi:hypothetical protein